MIHTRNNKKMTAILEAILKFKNSEKDKKYQKISNAFFKNSDQDSRWSYLLFVLS